jgi:hypothetical protein
MVFLSILSGYTAVVFCFSCLVIFEKNIDIEICPGYQKNDLSSLGVPLKMAERSWLLQPLEPDTVSTGVGKVHEALLFLSAFFQLFPISASKIFKVP